MSEQSGKKLTAVTTLSIAVVSSLIGGLLLAYFTSIIFRPEVLYTVTGTEIKLPDIYKKELAKIRAEAFAKNMENFMGGSRKKLTVEPGIKGNKIGIKKHDLTVFGPNLLGNKDSMSAVGSNFQEMLEKIEKPEAMKALLNPSDNFPTAFATVNFVNTGNREADDLEISINPNGVLIESDVTATEPSAEKWERIVDAQEGLPIGIHLPPIKRLPVGGNIQVKIFWHQLGPIDISKDADEKSPTVSVTGSYSGGVVQYTEPQPSSVIKWPLLIMVSILISLSSIALGLWLRRPQKQ